MTQDDYLVRLQHQKAVAERRENRIKLVTAGLTAMTAVATLLGVLLGFSAKKASDATAQADDSQRQIQGLKDDNSTLREQLEQLKQSQPSDPALPSGTESPATTNSQPPPGETKVTLAALCNAPGASVYICGSDYKGTIEVGDQIFTHVGEGNGFADTKPPRWGNLLDFPSTTCSKIVVNFAARDASGTANIRIIQTGAQPQVASRPAGKIGTFTATLNGSPFRLQYNTENGGPVYVDGYAMCSTDSGVVA